MKRRRPVELAFRLKIVPLNAVTHTPKTAKERLPARSHITPRRRFGKNSAPFRRIFWINLIRTHDSSGRIFGEESPTGKG
jgi:hypothetical protein